MTREYAITPFPDEWLFDDAHDDDWDRYEAERGMAFGEVIGLARSSGCVRIDYGREDWFYLHMAPDGWLHATKWDGRGPVGHARIASALQLAREVGADNFTATCA